MASASSNIVVWEWFGDFGQWIPYNPVTCQKLEKNSSKGKYQFSIEIMMQSTRHNVKYDIDLQQMTQTSLFTGNIRQMRRSIYPSSSAIAQGTFWEWCQNSGRRQSWTPYPVDLSNEIHQQYSQAQKVFVFPAHYNLPYKVNFKKKVQKNSMTGYERPIRQSFHSSTKKYPLDSGSFPLSNGTLQSNTLSSGSIYPHHSNPVTTVPGYPYLGHPSNLSGPLGSTYPHSQQPVYPSAGGSSQPILGQFAPNLPQTTPSTSATSPVPVSQKSGSSTVNTSNTVKTKKSSKKFHVPQCPPGGIPCNAAASTGTVPVAQVLKNFTKKIDVDANSTDHCAICQSKLTENSGFGSSSEACELKLCKHVFHCECLEASYSHGVKNGCIVCSTCNKMHGIKTGNQPDGVMRYSKMSTSLPGHPGCGTLQVEYHIQSGTQKAEHPHPGKHYSTPGFPRIGYIPDNNEGRRVLLLLIEAWKRRLIFTVGQSSTSGQDDCVTWTGIHHKTEMQSNRGHGYPDDTYLDRVMAELEAEGVTEDT